jgi:hypothetical protein
MKSLRDLEKEILELPAAEREHLARVAWDSLDESLLPDEEGLAMAAERDEDIEAGRITTIDERTFRQQTAAKPKR